MATQAFKISGNLSSQEKCNVDTILHLNSLVNRGDYDAMDELFHPDYQDHNPGWQVKSVADLKSLIRFGHDSFQLHNEIDWGIASGDKVFVRVLNHGRHATPVFGMPPSGKDTCMTTFEIYRFSDSKIAERWVMSDLLGLMRQVGAKLPPGLS